MCGCVCVCVEGGLWGTSVGGVFVCVSVSLSACVGVQMLVGVGPCAAVCNVGRKYWCVGLCASVQGYGHVDGVCAAEG